MVWWHLSRGQQIYTRGKEIGKVTILLRNHRASAKQRMIIIMVDGIIMEIHGACLITGSGQGWNTTNIAVWIHLPQSLSDAPTSAGIQLWWDYWKGSYLTGAALSLGRKAHTWVSGQSANNTYEINNSTNNSNCRYGNWMFKFSMRWSCH